MLIAANDNCDTAVLELKAFGQCVRNVIFGEVALVIAAAAAIALSV
jgi:hypothetical protein